MLIFSNGIVSFYKNNEEGYLDENGNPIKPKMDLIKECQCYINTLSEDKKGKYSDGKYYNCSYSISFNMSDVGNNFKPEIISILHKNKGYLGEFNVQRTEYYTITDTIEIWV